MKEMRDLQSWMNKNSTTIISFIFVAIGAYLIYNNLANKGKFGSELMSKNSNKAYKNSGNGNGGSSGSSNSSPMASDSLGQNESYAEVNGISTPSHGLPASCTKPNIQNPSDLLPKDSNNQWAQLNPSGKGDLANINLLKAGYHIGIDTIGQSLRNANLQIRSEPPNPQTNVGPWNQSTISSDFLRPVLEIGGGGLQ